MASHEKSVPGEHNPRRYGASGGRSLSAPCGRLLTGLKVLDLSQFIPGPYATRLLADQGADVLKVEPPRGDPMRSLLSAGANTLSPVYQTLNRGKRIVCLDLKTNDGKRKFTGLAQRADVLLESYRPGVMARLGLDWPALRGGNPALIYCSLSGYGQSGRYREMVGHDINYCAAAGLYSAAPARGKPGFTFPPIADHVGAMLAANTILSALYAHARDGNGRYLDVSIYESVLAFRYLNNIRAAGGGIGHVDFLGGGAACYNIYTTADNRFITLGAVESKFWRAFCDAMGERGWRDRQHEPLPQQALTAEVQTRIGEQPLAHWNALLLEVECCYQPVPQDHRVLRHPQTVDRRLAVENDIRYPAWIDGRPPASPEPLEQLDPDATPGWLNA